VLKIAKRICIVLVLVLLFKFAVSDPAIFFVVMLLGLSFAGSLFSLALLFNYELYASAKDAYMRLRNPRKRRVCDRQLDRITERLRSRAVDENEIIFIEDIHGKQWDVWGPYVQDRVLRCLFLCSGARLFPPIIPIRIAAAPLFGYFSAVTIGDDIIIIDSEIFTSKKYTSLGRQKEIDDIIAHEFPHIVNRWGKPHGKFWDRIYRLCANYLKLMRDIPMWPENPNK